jgi:hypothetical protein
MAIKAIGTVFSIGWSSSNPTNTADVCVDYMLSEWVDGPMSGRAILTVDITLNDTQVTQTLRDGLAAWVNNLAVSLGHASPGLVSADIRGCNV